MLTTNPDVVRVHQQYYAQMRLDNQIYEICPGPHVELPEPSQMVRGPARRTNRMYSMQDQATDAQLWIVEDRSTGQALGRVRGTAVWARDQMQMLALSLRCPLQDLFGRRP